MKKMVNYKIELENGTETEVKGISNVVQYLIDEKCEWEPNAALYGPHAVIRDVGFVMAYDEDGRGVKITVVRGAKHH